MSRIKYIVQKLVKEYGTRDPFVIAEKLGIKVYFRPYSNMTSGYYTKIDGQQFIVINSNLSKEEQIVIMAHELGHACLHESLDIAFTGDIIFPKEYYENESNVFAAELLIDDEIIAKNKNASAEQIAKKYKLPKELVKIKLDHYFINI